VGRVKNTGARTGMRTLGDDFEGNLGHESNQFSVVTFQSRCRRFCRSSFCFS
jgi:hypothetical protein